MGRPAPSSLPSHPADSASEILQKAPETPASSSSARRRIAQLGIVGGIMGIATISSHMICSSTGIQDFGYPVHYSGDHHEAFLKLWAGFRHDKKLINTLNFGDIPCEFIGRDEDLDKAKTIHRFFKELMREIPIQPDGDLKKLVMIFSDESEGRIQEGATGITMAKRIDGIQYVIFSGELNPDIVKHELIHAMFQTSASKQLPDFVAEGTVHDLYDPETDLKIRDVDSTYLLGHLPGLYSSDGNLSKGLNPSDADYLQDEVMRRFWAKLSDIDPTISYKLLQLDSSQKISKLQEIPALVLSQADESKQTAVQAFLRSCAIFDPIQGNRLFVIPDVDDDQKPQIMVYYLDEDYYALPYDIDYWYSSSLDDITRSPFLEDPSHTTSNLALTFQRYNVEDGFDLTFRIQNPQTGETFTLSFDYQASDGWVYVN